MSVRTSTLGAAMASVLAAALALFAAIDRGRALPLDEGSGAQIQCVSYAPYRLPGETPFDPEAWVSAERLTEDLRLLSARTNCIRTYSVRQGLEQVPAIAQSLGMKVLLGAWIGSDPDANEAELAGGIALANAWPQTVRALIVGNEVLLRRELRESQLAALLKRARAESSVPVTYADVWEFWSEHASLAEQVSFVTVHILPYWEDHPVAIGRAVPHVVEIASRMRDRFAGKEILIGETGWPSAGRMREGARPGRIEQARFFREFSVAARAHGLKYNFIEAFDQPWKRRLEGAMGGAWGVFDSSAAPKFPATGPVSADPAWRRWLLAAIACTALFVAAGIAARRSRRTDSRCGNDSVDEAPVDMRVDTSRMRIARLAGLAAVGWSTGMALFAQWAYLLTWARDTMEWLAGLSLALAGLGLAAHAAHGFVLPRNADLWRFTRRMAHRAGVFVLFALAVMMTLLVFDSRYRGFPIALYALPAVAMLVLRAGGWLCIADRPEVRLLGVVVGVGGAVVVLMEGLANTDALAFVALAYGYVLVLAVGCGSPARSRTKVKAPSRAATAEGSAE